MAEWTGLFRILILLLGFTVSCRVDAQKDSVKKNRIDSLILKRKGILKQLGQSLLADTGRQSQNQLVRNDLPFQPFNNRIIHKIIIQSVDFNVSGPDSARKIVQQLTALASSLHHKTRSYVINNNLFFKENQLLSPYLLGNNERHLRDLPFLQEARIVVEPLAGSTDSVDVIIITKDVFSIGGSLDIRSSQSVAAQVKEDNFGGWGDRLLGQTLYDQHRNTRFGYGVEYIKRNIAGSFIDGDFGFLTYNSAFNSGRNEEEASYIRFIKPLVNPYMLWTYGVAAEMHSTKNMYNIDSTYQNSIRYKYQLTDAWGGLNLSTKHISAVNEFARIRWLLGLRLLDQKFLTKPGLYQGKYFYAYADIRALLSSISLFKFNFYKTSYIYGFGRKEDVPEGLEATFTTGWTQKNSRDRPYLGFNFQRYFFTKREAYFNYTLRAGGYLYKKQLEDINVLGSIDYFSRIHQMTKRWKQREFLNASITRQFNTLLDGPLFLESTYGLPDFKNNYFGGNIRATVKAESVFFSPWSVLLFKFAPFIFGSTTFFHLNNPYGLPDLNANKSKIISAVGGGIRTRNESLIFGTIELRLVYFPTRDFYNHNYAIEFNTNIRFRYNQNFIRRPDFVQMN
ncbi:MAG: hypothetical protein NVSMB67_18160 [Flavisolibacter sp.]